MPGTEEQRSEHQKLAVAISNAVAYSDASKASEYLKPPARTQAAKERMVGGTPVSLSPHRSLPGRPLRAGAEDRRLPCSSSPRLIGSGSKHDNKMESPCSACLGRLTCSPSTTLRPSSKRSRSRHGVSSWTCAA